MQTVSDARETVTSSCAANNSQTMSASTVPSGSMADVYCRAKGKVTLVNVFAGNLGGEKSIEEVISPI